MYAELNGTSHAVPRNCSVPSAVSCRNVEYIPSPVEKVDAGSAEVGAAPLDSGSRRLRRVEDDDEDVASRGFVEFARLVIFSNTFVHISAAEAPKWSEGVNLLLLPGARRARVILRSDMTARTTNVSPFSIAGPCSWSTLCRTALIDTLLLVACPDDCRLLLLMLLLSQKGPGTSSEASTSPPQSCCSRARNNCHS